MPVAKDAAAFVATERDIIVGGPDNPVDSETTETTPFLEARERSGTRQDSWAGLDDFEGLPWWREPSVYWLLGPFFLFTLAFGGMIVPKLNLIVDLVCRKHFADQAVADPNFTFIPVTFGADNPQCFVPEVKKRTSMFMLALNLVTGILAALAAPRFGKLSDRYGRTKLLALASCGGVMAELITILCAKYPDTIHYNWLILAAFCDGATGSYTSGTILSSSYTSDCTPPSKRAVSIGYVQACLFTGLAFGPILAGYFVTFTGSLLSIFYVTLGCHIFFIIFVGFVVPESLSERRRTLAQEKHAEESRAHGLDGNPWRASVHVANVLSPLKALWPSKPGATSALRMNLAALAGIDMVLVGVAVSAGPVILLYCESEDTWGWGTLESSRFMSSVSLVRVVVLLVILPTINYFGRTRPAARRASESGTPTVDVNAGADNLDLWVLRVALVSDVVGSLGYLLARSEAVFVFSGMLTALGGLGSATIQAAVTKHVPAEQVGQVLGAIGLLHGAARVVGPIAFNSLYSATVGKFDQAIFALLAGIYIMALLASFTVRPRVFLKEMEEPVEEEQSLLHSHRREGEAASD